MFLARLLTDPLSHLLILEFLLVDKTMVKLKGLKNLYHCSKKSSYNKKSKQAISVQRNLFLLKKSDNLLALQSSINKKITDSS